MGAGVGELSQKLSHSVQSWEGLQQVANEEAVYGAHRAMSVRDLINAGRNGGMNGVLQPHKIGVPLDAGRRQRDANSLALTPADIAKELPGGMNAIHVIHMNTRDGPHHLVREPGETELKPASHTNYDWKVPSKCILQELKEYILTLRAHRAKFSAQAQVIWLWLAEKESQYYHLRDRDHAVGYDAEQAKQQLRAYCEVLSSEHLTLGIAVSKIDWIIADSQKRMAQHQQNLKDDPRTSNEQKFRSIARSELGFVLERLQDQVQQAGHDVKSISKTIELIERDLKDPRVPHVPEPVGSMLRRAPKRDREQIMHALLEDGKETRQKAMVQKAAAEEVLRDAEARAWRTVDE